MNADASARIADEAAALFRPAGRFAYHFARGKLSRDPLFAALLRSRAIPDQPARVLDLGCGQGLLAAWLAVAQGPRAVVGYRGIDRSAADLARARAALSPPCTFEQHDLAQLADTDLGRCDVVALLDVLHYLSPDAQHRLLAQVHGALLDDGVLVLRVGDGASRGASHWSNAVDRVVSVVRGRPPARLHRRSLAAWLALLEELGFAPVVLERHDTSTFANVLLRATRRTRGDDGALLR